MNLRPSCLVLVLLFGLGGAVTARAASTFTGYVTDSTGVDGIPGAIVSLEWYASRPNSQATVVAIWQTRADAKGWFQISGQPAGLTLPAGTSPAPGAFPKLRVLAYGHKTYSDDRLSGHVSTVDAGLVRLTFPDGENVIRLISPPESAAFLTQQTAEWLDELDKATREQASSTGSRQALSSYRPLISLMEDSCYRYRLSYGTSTPACQRAKVRFSLKEPTPKWEQALPRHPPDDDAPTAPLPVFMPSKPEAAASEGIKQQPPDQ